MSDSGVLQSGDSGLDLLLGGGFRPFPRGQERPSLTVLVRGPAGCGKTVLAASIASHIAGQRAGNVAYACVELLPEELKAQLDGLGVPEAQVQTPPFADRPQPHRLFAGLLPFDPRSPSPGFLDSLDQFVDSVPNATVLVIDSVSSGYGLVDGSRPELVDGVCKFSAGRGLFTIIVEEAERVGGSAWPFATDVVIELRRGEDTSRELWISKNRTGPADEGWTRFRIGHGRGIEVMPRASAYRGLTEAFRRRPIPLKFTPAVELGHGKNNIDFGRHAAIWSVTGEGPREATWIAMQLVAVDPTVARPADVRAGFAGVSKTDGRAVSIDGLMARSIDEFIASLVAHSLQGTDAAPIVRIDDIHVGAQLLGDRFPQEVIVAADVLRRAGCQVLLCGLPSVLTAAADVRISFAIPPGRPDRPPEYLLRRRGRQPVSLAIKAPPA